MSTESYQTFRRALSHLQSQGYETSRILRTANALGYSGFQNLAPSGENVMEFSESEAVGPDTEKQYRVIRLSNDRVLRDYATLSYARRAAKQWANELSARVGIFRKSDGEKLVTVSPDVGTSQEKTPEGRGDFWPSIVFARYQAKEGLSMENLGKYADGIEYVEMNSPGLGEILEDVEADLRVEDYRVKHWFAVLGSLWTDAQEWSSEQDSRRRELKTRVLEMMESAHDGDDEIRRAWNEIKTQSGKLNPKTYGEWLSENVEIQGWILGGGSGQEADWIEVTPPGASWF